MRENSKSVLRTKRLLKEALLSIIEEKDCKTVYERFDKISVKDICERAEISRATFYQYYDSYDDFIYKLIEEISEKFSKQLMHWLLEGRTGLPESSKRSNLLIDETEREIFYLGVDGNIQIQSVSSVNRKVSENIKILIKGTFLEDLYINSNEDFGFFFRGCFFVCLDLMHNYRSKVGKEKLDTLFDIFECTFKMKLP